MSHLEKPIYLAATFLFSVIQPQSALADIFVRDDIITDPTPDAFTVCLNHTCKNVSTHSLNLHQWQQIRNLFTPTPVDSTEERRRIAQAIARLEKIVGDLAGTANDKGGNLEGLFSDGGQLDCIDESTNTSTYLTMLQNSALIRWHTVEDRSTRGFFIFGLPHTTAVLKEISTNEYWAVDSWFHDNGLPPEIVPLHLWKSGWKPTRR